MIPLERLGAVAVFSSTKYLLDRVGHSLVTLPVVETIGSTSFIGKFARATDLYSSVSPLIDSQVSRFDVRTSGHVFIKRKRRLCPSSVRNSGFHSDDEFGR